MTTRAIACAVVLLLVAVPAAAPAAETGNAAPLSKKDTQTSGEPTYEGRVEGETIETAFVIDWLPFFDSIDTCPFLDDYDEACPYDGSTSPDVVYSYLCMYDCTVVIDLCESDYDTKVYVYENEHTPGWPLACNDDYPGCGPNGYRSWIMTEFEQGNTYYIVVDGYTGDCGTCELYIEDYVPCVQCPSGAFVETEPGCMDPLNDIDNGGCNSDPPVFDYLEPSEETINVCGTSGTYVAGNNNYRDTDWYQIDLANESEIDIWCIANFLVRIGFVDGREGCEGASSYYSYVDGYPCGLVQLVETLPAGTWWIWVGPANFTDVPCGEEYVFELTGYTPVTPVEDASWSTIKALFR